MMRYHLMTALVVGFLIVFEEITTDEKDDCLKYKIPIDTSDTLGDLAEECFEEYSDYSYALSCVYEDDRVAILHEPALLADRINKVLKRFANPDKLKALRKSTNKCVKGGQEYTYYYNCTFYDMLEICPKDQFIKLSGGK